jgi:hypothetical protein
VACVISAAFFRRIWKVWLVVVRFYAELRPKSAL